MSTLQPSDPRHGTTNGYSNYHCRCAECRQANTEYSREKYGAWMAAPNVWSKWELEDDEIIQALPDEPLADLAYALGRTEGAVYARQRFWARVREVIEYRDTL